MNKLLQFEDGILASADDVETLKNKENAKILVISDSHGNINFVKEIISKLAKDCDCVIFTGDGIYDFLGALESLQKDKKINKIIPPVVVYVRGNGDTTRVSSSLNNGNSLRIPSKVKITIANKHFYIVHGNGHGVYYGTSMLEAEAEVEDCNVAVFGHTHVPFEELHSVYLMNPGSCSSPRGKSPKSVGIIEVIGPNINSIFYKIEETLGLVKFVPYFPDKLPF